MSRTPNRGSGTKGRDRVRMALEALESRLVPAQYYVATTGSDSAAGTSAAPFKTIQHAADLVTAGDTVTVRAGSHAGFILGWDFTTSGTAAKPILFQADPAATPGTVIINSRNPHTHTGIQVEPGCSYLYFQGFTILGGGTIADYPNQGFGIRVNGDFNRVINNTILDLDYGTAGIHCNTADGVVIEGNTVARTGAHGVATRGHGIYIANGDGIVVRGNTLYDNEFIGVHVNGDPNMVTNALIEKNVIHDNGQNGINADGLASSRVQNNLIYGYANYGIVLYTIDSSGPSANNVIVNNTIVATKAGSLAALRIRDGATGNTVRNNVLLGGGGVSIRISDDSKSGLVSNYNVVAAKFQSEDTGGTQTWAQWQSATGQDKQSFTATTAQLFVNAAGFDYHHISTSPAIDTGTGTGAPATDLDGNARPVGPAPDVGSYEYTTSVPPPPNTPPTISNVNDLSITGNGTTGALSFTVGDSETAAGNLVVSATSSNTTLVPLSKIVFGGNGANRTVTVTPAANLAGTATITVTVQDAGGATASDPFVLTVTPAVTTTTAANKSLAYSNSTVSVSLSATVSTGVGTLGAGTVTFTILNGAVTIGTPVIANVSGGAASANYSLPAGTASAAYTIRAAYGGTSNLAASTDTTHTLSITPAATTTAAVNASTVFSQLSQSVALSVSVTSAAGTVGAGTVTFTILNGATTIGTPVTANVTAGVASANYALPAGTSGGNYTIRAAYSGTANFGTSTDTSHTLAIATATTTTTAANATVGYNGSSQTFSLSATVTSPAGTVNAGSVTFTILNGTTTIGSPVTANVSGGAVSANYSLPAGTVGGIYTVRAAYNGTVNLANSLDTTHTLTVTPAATTTVGSDATAVFSVTGQSVALAATVSSSAGVVTAGTVTFTVLNGATTIGSPITANVTSGAASASYSLPSGLATGTYTVRAAYNGAASFSASTDATHDLTVTPASSTTTAAPASVVATPGSQVVQLSAAVVSSAGTLSVGSVTFTVLNGAVTVGSPVVANVTNGTATANYTLPAGTGIGIYTIRAEYSGTSNVTGSSDSTHTLTVASSSSTTTATNATVTYSGSGQAINLNATVSSPAGTVNSGTVTFTVLNGATTIGNPVTVNVSGGSTSASYALPAGTPGGTYTVRAAYNGTTSFAASSDSSHTLTVTPAATTTAGVDVGVGYNGASQSVVLTATLSSAAGTVNAGTVTFTVLNGAATVGSPVTANVVNGLATATFSLPAGTSAGAYTIRAAYNSTGNFSTSADSTHSLLVTASPTTVTASAVSVVYSGSTQSVNLNATVRSPAGTVNVGTVTFTVRNGGAAVGSTVVANVTNGVATLDYELPGGTAAGAYTIHAEYSGTSDLSPSIDTAHILTISIAPSAVTASSVSIAFSRNEQMVTLTASVTSPAGNVNDGTVTFTVLNGATVVGSAVVSAVTNGSATASYTLPALLAAGTYALRAEYTGSNYSNAVDSAHVLTLTGGPTPPPVSEVVRFAVGADAGGSDTVTSYNADGTAAQTFTPFPGFAGGVRTAVADFNGDGVGDLVVGTGAGGPTHVRVLDGVDGRELFAIEPFEGTFTGGVFVAAGDLTGDGIPDLVITPDEGGGPRCRVFTGSGFSQVADFFGIEDSEFRGGVRPAIGDIDGDGAGDLIVAAGFGGGPRIAAFSGRSLGEVPTRVFADYLAFEPTLRNGTYVAAGDVDGDGRAEVIVGGGPGGAPRVSVLAGRDLLANVQTRVADFFAGDVANRGGVRLAVKELDGGIGADLIVGSGTGAGSRVTAYAGTGVRSGAPVELFSLNAFEGFAGGVFVG